MALFHFLRHGKITSPPGLYGQTDVQVNPESNFQIVKSVLNKIKDIDVIITSPLSRCSSLATMLARYYNCEVFEEPMLQEMNFGDLDGTAFEDIKPETDSWNALSEFWQDPSTDPLPNAEPLQYFNERVVAAWKNLTAHYEDNNVLVVCHGGVIRMLVAHILQLNYANPTLYTTLAIEFGSLTKIGAIGAVDPITRIYQISEPCAEIVKHANSPFDDFNENTTPIDSTEQGISQVDINKELARRITELDEETLATLTEQMLQIQRASKTDTDSLIGEAADASELATPPSMQSNEENKLADWSIEDLLTKPIPDESAPLMATDIKVDPSLEEFLLQPEADPQTHTAENPTDKK